MTVVISIGFHYQERLPALIDITTVHPLLAKGAARSLVISDLDPRDRCAVSALTSHDGSDNGLCDRVAELQNYHTFRGVPSLLALLRGVASQHVVLYYSGHNTGEGIILPDGGRLAWQEVLDALDPLSFVALLDCCRGPRLDLPFSWHDRAWRRDLRVAAKYRGALVLLICSTEEHEDSYSSSIGSPYTLQLAAWLAHPAPDFCTLQALYPSTRIYSSLPAAPLWRSVVL